MDWKTLGVFGVLLLAGCVSATPNMPSFSTATSPGPRCIPGYSSEGPVIRCEQILTGKCAQGYYVGCDDNPDAAYMLNTYGLHQITNVSGNATDPVRITNPLIEDGLASWIQGGFGFPSSYWAMNMETKKQATLFRPLDVASHLPFPGGSAVFYGRTPILVVDGKRQPGNETFHLWHPDSGEIDNLSKPSKPGSFGSVGFDGKWALVRNHLEPVEQDQLWAIRVATGRAVELFAGGPVDSTMYGGPLVANAIAAGHAYLSLRTEHPNRSADTRIVDIDLENGTRQDILNVTGATILEMDAGERYVVAPIRGRVMVMDRSNGTWFDLTRSPKSDPFYVRTAGEWVVYSEARTDDRDGMPFYVRTVLAVHVPTMRYHEMLSYSYGWAGNGNDFVVASLDTDGRHLILHVGTAVNVDTKLKFEGAQLYWMPLPEV